MRKHKTRSDRVSKAHALYRAGRHRDATLLLRTILNKSPDDPDALELMAEITFKQRDITNATRLLERLAKISPGSFSAHNKLAVVYALQQRMPEAAARLRLAIQIKPDYLPAYLDLCKVSREMGLLDESINAGRKAVALKPEDPRAHGTLALSYERFGRHRDAHTHYTRAAELAPDDVHRQFACGVSHMGAGEKQAARAKFEQVIDRMPDHAQAHWMLSRLKRYDSSGDEAFKRLRSLLANPGIDEDQRSYLYFALGKMYEDCAEYDTAFENFAAGNRIENNRHDYEPSAYSERIDQLIETYSPEFFSRVASSGSGSEQPLFIVGMPRSGTTLVEQILASHSAVFGAGELSWFTKTENDLPAFIGSESNYPTCMNDIDESQIAALAGKYLGYIAAVSEHGDARYISDKMPSNFERIGLIKTLYPNARIIHCRRDPLDNAISQYTLLFQGNMAYSHDLHNLGTHYAEYERLMSHWKKCFPGQIFDVQYETLVQDHEQLIRQLLEFLRLDWEAQCLNFFEAQRAVRTSSDFQVRRPIYSSSVARWKHYEKFLEPLKRGLRDGGLQGFDN